MLLLLVRALRGLPRNLTDMRRWSEGGESMV